MASDNARLPAAFNGISRGQLQYCAVQDGAIFSTTGNFIHLNLETGLQYVITMEQNSRKKAPIYEQWRNTMDRIIVRSVFLSNRRQEESKKMVLNLVGNQTTSQILIFRRAFDLKRMTSEFIDEKMAITCDHPIDDIRVFPISADEKDEDKYISFIRGYDASSHTGTILSIIIRFFDNRQHFDWKELRKHTFKSNGRWIPIPIRYVEKKNQMFLINANNASECLLLSLDDGKETFRKLRNVDKVVPNFSFCLFDYYFTEFSSYRNMVLLHCLNDQKSELWSVDIKNENWKLLTTFGDHSIGGGDLAVLINPDGSAFVHGACAFAQCKTGAHIYPFDLKQDNYVDKLRRRFVLDGQQRIQMPSNIIKSAVKPQPNNPQVDGQLQRIPLRLQSSLHQSDVQTAPKSQSHFCPKNYVEQEIVGKGKFGVVRKCFDKDVHRHFVAKAVTVDSDKMKEMAEKEIETLKSLIHKHIVEYYGCKIGETTVTIFMEYLPAGSLKKVIDEHGPVMERTVINYILQILNGLSYVHNIPIVHSDIKCDNLLLDGLGNVKIGDFGLAMSIRINDASYTQSLFGTAGGTIYWAAPEVLRQETFGRRADIWSLGCTIVEMLNGKPPYTSIKVAQLIFHHFNRSLSYDVNELVPNASEKLKRFLSKLLQFEAKNRPHTAVEASVLFKSVHSAEP